MGLSSRHFYNSKEEQVAKSVDLDYLTYLLYLFMDKEKIIKNWIESSNRDFETMNNLFNSKDYHWALFIGHLVIEKLLKALYVLVKDNNAPFIHDLRKLALESNLELDKKTKLILDTITTFNINARYSNYKDEFYKKCGMNYTKIWIENIKETREWILKKLNQ